jgi:hypothetical protein
MTAYSPLPAGLEPRQIQAIERVNYLRGRIITHYAQCEFLLADISVTLGYIPARSRAAPEVCVNRTNALPGHWYVTVFHQWAKGSGRI